jgi:hypothetical protein
MRTPAWLGLAGWFDLPRGMPDEIGEPPIRGLPDISYVAGHQLSTGFQSPSPRQRASPLLWKDSHEASAWFQLSSRDVSSCEPWICGGVAIATTQVTIVVTECCFPSMSQVGAGARGDLFRMARTRIDAAVRTLVVAAAGPGILPGGPTAIAFVVVDEGGLAAGLVVPLMRAFPPLSRQ